MTVRLFLAGERVGPQLRRSNARHMQRMRSAQRGAARDVVDYVETRGRANIAGAGRFGKRWTGGFIGRVVGRGRDDVDIVFTMKVPYWRVFQDGATISGRPLLWIPLSFAKQAQGKRARDYPGKLFRVDRKSGKAPLLLGGTPPTPKYFGIASVRIPKKFRLVEIAREGAKKLGQFYKEHMKDG